jgi:hypothetical protein
MTNPKVYNPVGHCIYCGEPHYVKTDPLAKLGDEHIIAAAFDGNLVLPEASCQECERTTSGLETHCIEQMVRNTREHLGLRARRHRRNRKHLPVSVDRGSGPETVRVPVADHPAALFMFSFEPPRLLYGVPDPEGGFAGKIVIRPMTADLGTRADRLGGKVNLIARGGFDAPLFGRMLAKIAHSFAVAELGLNGFRPLLNDLILGKPTRHAAQFVGGVLTPEPKGQERNEISISQISGVWRDYHVVRLRLFADLEMPTYEIVVGEPLIQARAAFV